jgi:hypothetical protein
MEVEFGISQAVANFRFSIGAWLQPSSDTEGGTFGIVFEQTLYQNFRYWPTQFRESQSDRKLWPNFDLQTASGFNF